MRDMAVGGTGRFTLGDVRLCVLGAGTPTPTSERFGSGYAVVVGKEVLLVDCGPATTEKLVQAGLWPLDVSHLFFTHHHFDHDVDYPCLLLCRWDQSTGREPTLQVYGPAPTSELTDKLIGERGAFAHDWKARIGHPTSQRVFVNRGGALPRMPPVVDAFDIEPGWAMENEGWRMTCCRAQHVQPYLDSVAYRLDTGGASIVFTGDTEPCDEVVSLAAGADLLIGMCWDLECTMWGSGESRGQCGARGAGEMARAAGVKRLVLSHLGPSLSKGGAHGEAMAEVREHYDGDVAFAEQLEWVVGDDVKAQSCR